MDKLFLRFYLNLLVALMLGAVVFGTIIVPRVSAQVSRNVEKSIAPEVRLIAEVLTDEQSPPRDVQATLERASRRLDVPAALVEREALSLTAAEWARVDRGEVVRAGEPERSVFHSTLRGTDKILRIGPIDTLRPNGRWRFLVLASPFLCALMLGVYALLRPVRRRLDGLARAARELGHGQLGARAEVGAKDAFGEVATTFNAMATRIQDLVASQQEMLHMTSHELRAPIQRLCFTLDRLRRTEDPAERERVLQRTERDLDEMDDLIEELLTYVRLRDRPPNARVPLELRPFLHDLCDTLADGAVLVTLSLPTAGDEGPSPGGPVSGSPRVKAEAKLLRRALANLVSNARRHARSRVVVQLEDEDEGDRVHVHVDDDGPGIPREERERIFEPFHRMNDAQTQETRGFGLGLAIVRRIADLHGGSVFVDDSPLGGARFTFSLSQEG